MNAAEFNSLYPVGTPVFAYPGFRPEDASDARRLVTRTRTKAQTSASGDPVVWVEGEGSYICLTHVDPVSEEQFAEARATETAAAVAALGALPVPVGAQPQPLDDQRLAEIAERTPKRAAALTAWLNQNSPVDGQRALENAETVLAEDVPALLAEVQRLKAERHSTNEVLSDTAEALREMRDRLAEYERPAYAYPPALPWARLMDDEDLSDFLDELAASAVTHGTSEGCLAPVENTIAQWRLIAEAQHAHNTAPGPDAEEPRSCCAGPVCTCTPSSPQDDEYIPPREDQPGMRHAVRTTIPTAQEAS